MKWKNRSCDKCEKVEYTASKSTTCKECLLEEKKKEFIAKEKEFLAEYGYKVIGEPVIDKFNHREYTLNTPCGHQWTAPYTNLLKQIKNAKSKNLRPACGYCGPKHRFANALAKYVEKYARDYDISQYEDYMRLVRRTSEMVYKKNQDILNPNSYVRGRNHGYHLDHITPIIECFKLGWEVEQAAGLDNLQLLRWQDNLSKGSRV